MGRVSVDASASLSFDASTVGVAWDQSHAWAAGRVEVGPVRASAAQKDRQALDSGEKTCRTSSSHPRRARSEGGALRRTLRKIRSRSVPSQAGGTLLAKEGNHGEVGQVLESLGSRSESRRRLMALLVFGVRALAGPAAPVLSSRAAAADGSIVDVALGDQPARHARKGDGDPSERRRHHRRANASGRRSAGRRHQWRTSA